jgi:hypothetical protein
MAAGSGLVWRRGRWKNATAVGGSAGPQSTE